MTCGEASCHCFKFTCKFVFSSLGLCGVVVLYVLLGAVLFKWLEGAAEIDELNRAKQLRYQLVTTIRDDTIRLFKGCREIQPGGAFDMSTEIPTESTIHTNTNSPTPIHITTNSPTPIPTVTPGEPCTLPFIHESLDELIWNHLTKYEASSTHQEPSHKNSTNDSEELKMWTMANSVLFATTVITTIGYGNLVPKTLSGQCMTIIYAIIGVPLMLITLASMGNFLATCFRFLYARCCAPMCSRLVKFCCLPSKRRRTRNTQQPQQQEKQQDTCHTIVQAEDGASTSRIPLRPHRHHEHQEIPIYMCLIVIVVYLISVASLFKFWEAWSWFKAIYFCFITFSTIGFGDIVPGHRSLGGDSVEDAYKAGLCAVTVLFGLVIMSMCFNLMQDTVMAYCRGWCKRLRGTSPEQTGDSSRENSYVSIREKPLSKSTLKGKRKQQPSPTSHDKQANNNERATVSKV